MSVRKLYLPVADTEEEAEDAFHKLCQALVIELGQKFEKIGKAQIGDDWQQKLVFEGGNSEEIHNWTSPYDPSFVFSFPLKYKSSILWRILPNNAEFYSKFKSCRWSRNRWEHRSVTPSLAALKSDMEYFAYVAKEANLKLWDALPQLLERVNAILSGTYLQDAAEVVVTIDEGDLPEEAVRAVEKDDADRLERENARDRERSAEAAKYPRPRVGAVWVGPQPTRALRLKKQLNDLVDVETRQSVKAEWGEEANLQIARLKTIDPMGDLYVADDGALFGYKYGVARLMGYLGAEPERDLNDIQGFELPYSYTLTDSGIFCDSNNTYLSNLLGSDADLLTSVLRKAVNPLDEIKITTHGDLYSITESGPKKIARVVASDWFPGHLPG
jgi:hypothetical protein